MLRGSKNSENSWEQSCQLRYTKTRGYTRAMPYAQEPDCMGDEELWGEDKDKYTMADLERWLDLKNGVKGKVLKKGKKTEKIVGKGKEKEEKKEKKKRVHRKKE